MKNPKFQIFKSRDNQFRFRLIARNGRIILASEGYVARAGCQNGIDSVKVNARFERRFQREVSKKGSPYFVLRAKTGEPIGNSEMYKTKWGREKGIEAVKRIAPSAPVEDTTR